MAAEEDQLNQPDPETGEFNPLQQSPLDWQNSDSQGVGSDELNPYVSPEVEPAAETASSEPLPRAGRIAIMLVGLVVIESGVGLVAMHWILSQIRLSDQTVGFGGLNPAAMFTLFAVAAFLGTPIVILFSILLRRKLDRRTAVSMGWLKPTPPRVGLALLGLLLGALPMLVTAGIVVLVGRFEVQPGNFSWQFAWMLPILILAALKEEVVFRGYITRIFWDDNQPLRGVVVSSVLFWLIHLANPHALTNPWVGVNLFFAGLFLGMTYLISNDLYFPTAAHFAWNFTQGPILGIPVSGIEMNGLVQLNPLGSETWIHGGKFGLEASALAALVVGILTAMLFLLWDSLQPDGELDERISSTEEGGSE